MRTKILAWLSTLLIVSGLLIPGAALAAGGDPLAAAAEALASIMPEPEPDGPLLVANTFSTTASVAAGFVSGDNLAPGDELTEEYSFTYTGPDTASVSISTSLSDGLTTCDGGDKFAVTLRDKATGQEYDPNKANQPVKVMASGETVTFEAFIRFALAASNDCQGLQALFSIQPSAVVHTPPSEPVTGSITVRVMDGSQESTLPTPIIGAAVELSSGLTGTTDASGQVTFTDLPAATYQVTVRATDPQNPVSSTLQVAVAEADITSEEREAFVNVILRWDPPLAPPVVPPIEPTHGTVTVIVLDGSARNGGNPLPIAGAEVTLGPGRTGWTDQAGKLLFSEVPFGAYEIVAGSRDPQNQNPLAITYRTARALASLDKDNPDAKVTVTLAWRPPPTPPAPLQVPPPPPAPGQIQGRLCSPKQPGAGLSATGPGGETAATFIAADGVLGKWRPYVLTGLTPGIWQLTLTDAAGKIVSQNLTVTPGGTVQAADFTLACTGDGDPLGNQLPVWPFMIGILLMAVGLLARSANKEA